MSENIGVIENYFSKVGVAVLNVTQGTINVGDKIEIKGSTSDFEMTIKSMQIDRVDVDSVSAGTKVGLKVPERVRPGDQVFKL
jgi:putative protease